MCFIIVIDYYKNLLRTCLIYHFLSPRASKTTDSDNKKYYAGSPAGDQASLCNEKDDADSPG